MRFFSQIKIPKINMVWLLPLTLLSIFMLTLAITQPQAEAQQNNSEINDCTFYFRDDDNIGRMGCGGSVQDATYTKQESSAIAGEGSWTYRGWVIRLQDGVYTHRVDRNQPGHSGAPIEIEVLPTQPTPPGDDSDSSDNATNCEDAGGFAWAFCGALELFSGALSYIDDQLKSMLEIPRDQLIDDNLRGAWTIIRNIAYLLLVPTMLVMIISTALGFEFISAYTAKKALPRMVAATIFIALSFDLSVFFIDFVQTVGNGIHNLLLLPFSDTYGLNSETTLADLNFIPTGAASEAGLSGLVIWGGILAGLSVAGGGLIATLAGFIGLAVLALLGVLTLLLIRQTIIVALILVAPIALLGWIFPGRTRIFSIWNKTFWLMMWFYPIIMITTAVGKITAAIVAGEITIGDD